MKSRNRDRYVYKPRTAMRLARRQVLLDQLCEEMKRGPSSVIQLYAGLLATTLVDEEPGLQRQTSRSSPRSKQGA